MANETKKFLDLTGLTRYDENIKNHITGITGNLSNLNTTNKSNLVGSINEVGSIAKGSTVAFSVASYSELISTFSSLPKTTYKVGQTVYVVTLDVPDLWISAISNTSSTYTYTTDDQVISDIEAGTLKVGYYTFSKMETQKVDLSNYVTESTLETEIGEVEDKIEEVELITSSSLNELNNKISENEELFARTAASIEARQEESEKTLSAAISNLGDKTEALETEIKETSEAVTGINDKFPSLSNAESLTYAELRELKEAKLLVPGKWYCITDYENTTTQENTLLAAGNEFDILVLATSNNTLNENAKARQHAGDIAQSLILYKTGEEYEDEVDYADYFKYVGRTMEFDGNTYYCWEKYEKEIGSDSDYKTDYKILTTKLYKEGDLSLENYSDDFIILKSDSEDYGGTRGDRLVEVSGSYSYSNFDSWELKYCFDNDTVRFPWADSENGKGVIYQLNDGERIIIIDPTKTITIEQDNKKIDLLKTLLQINSENKSWVNKSLWEIDSQWI